MRMPMGFAILVANVNTCKRQFIQYLAPQISTGNNFATEGVLRVTVGFFNTITRCQFRFENWIFSV